MMEGWGDLILAIDQSTSATKAVLIDRQGSVMGRASVGHRQYYPQPGWVGHDAMEIYENMLTAIGKVLDGAGVGEDRLAALAITNQRETALVWDRVSGLPIDHAVVWQCGRGSAICERLEREGKAALVREKTGLVLSPYFSAAKIQWLLDNVPGARQRADAGELLLGTVDSWLLWKLTGGAVHATDYSNACRTQLFNIRTLCWDDELLELFRIPRGMAPQVRCSDEVFGHTAPGCGFARPVPIAGLMGDSHAALFGQNCFAMGQAKATYGTGSSVMMNVGKAPVFSSKGLVSSLAWGRAGTVDYVLEGNINSAGDTIRWLSEDLEMIPEASVAGPIAVTVPDNGGVYLVPAFTGLGAPHWDSAARASITGISRGVRRAHVVRAAMESIAYQVKDILDLMIGESGVALSELRVDGGPTRDEFLMQFQADMLGVPVARSTVEELSALGAAFMAGLAVGMWSGLNEIARLRPAAKQFDCTMAYSDRERYYAGWREAVRRTLSAT